ncbi:MAG: AAA family ATPase [Rhodobacteraceae bacterium]|nr:AAA family ATPase [Paracoccaceae bacterium]MCY4196494.1 AAA family ATPase [Paracoccaceae bacterium]MCY4327791.1 AAA family ATPase [Paracoccaceae bacterium]
MPTMTRLKSVSIRGFRSLADVELSDLGNTSILIGANGSGKSNFVRFFEMLSWMLRSRRLGDFVERHGGGDDQLFGGSRITPTMQAEISLETQQGQNDYQFTLAHAHPDRLMFTKEAFRFSSKDIPTDANWTDLGGDGNRREAQIVEFAQSPQPSEVNKTTAQTITHLLRDCAAYQFHDTSDTSSFKISWDNEDNNTLRSNGGNLAAVLHRIEHEDYHRFELICSYISRVLPIFDHFKIESSYGKVRLRWKAKGTDKTFGAHLTSDGSLRFFALVTLLNLPREMLPSVILLDEPELGLHPAAISLIGGMIKALAGDVQVIAATQSPLLVDEFNLEEIVVLEAKDGRTNFRRLDTENYRDWLNESFAPGELWQKNLIGGRP